MAKKNGTKSKSKTAPKPRRRPKQNAARTTYETCLRDPFGQEGTGAKIPDFDARISATWRSSDYSTITTDASGYACVVYRFSNPAIAFKTTATNTSGNFKLNGGTSTAYGDFTGPLAYSINSCDSVRPVAGGIKLVPYQNANTAQGKVYVVPLSEHQVGVWNGDATGLTETAFRRASGSKTYSLASLTLGGTRVIARTAPCDPTSYAYIPPDSGYPTRSYYPNMVCIAVVVIGATASATVLDVEQVCHWEFLPGVSYEGIAGKAEPYSPGVLERVSKYLQTSEPIQEFAYSIGNAAMDSMNMYLSSFARNMPLRLTNG